VADVLSRLPSVLEPFSNLHERTAWPYLITGFLAAVAVWAVERRRGEQVSLRRFVFPGEVFGHRSARLDYRFVAIDLVLRVLVYVPILTTTSRLTQRAVLDVPGLRALGHALRPVPGRVVVIAVVLFLLVDLALYLGHLACHRIPALWALHEVHHSAEVLTPLTVLRVHPFEQVTDYLALGAANGIGAALWAEATARPVGLPTLLGVNVLTVSFFAVAYQLRHSHIWLSYGPRLSQWLVSPAQHQIHHSSAPEHWDRNMGFVFAFWDRIFGTLYVPTEREQITFGVAGADPADFATVRKLYALPVLKAWRRLPKPTLPRRGPDVTSISPEIS
jgi:sterol desaturase/sphingolipid hydroxylase (fatty acid hydroxylase superfamily)